MKLCILVALLLSLASLRAQDPVSYAVIKVVNLTGETITISVDGSTPVEVIDQIEGAVSAGDHDVRVCDPSNDCHTDHKHMDAGQEYTLTVRAVPDQNK